MSFPFATGQTLSLFELRPTHSTRLPSAQAADGDAAVEPARRKLVRSDILLLEVRHELRRHVDQSEVVEIFFWRQKRTARSDVRQYRLDICSRRFNVLGYFASAVPQQPSDLVWPSTMVTHYNLNASANILERIRNHDNTKPFVFAGGIWLRLSEADQMDSMVVFTHCNTIQPGVSSLCQQIRTLDTNSHTAALRTLDTSSHKAAVWKYVQGTIKDQGTSGDNGSYHDSNKFEDGPFWIHEVKFVGSPAGPFSAPSRLSLFMERDGVHDGWPETLKQLTIDESCEICEMEFFISRPSAQVDSKKTFTLQLADPSCSAFIFRMRSACPFVVRVVRSLIPLLTLVIGLIGDLNSIRSFTYLYAAQHQFGSYELIVIFVCTVIRILLTVPVVREVFRQSKENFHTFSPKEPGPEQRGLNTVGLLLQAVIICLDVRILASIRASGSFTDYRMVELALNDHSISFALSLYLSLFAAAASWLLPPIISMIFGNGSAGAWDVVFEMYVGPFHTLLILAFARLSYDLRYYTLVESNSEAAAATMDMSSTYRANSDAGMLCYILTTSMYFISVLPLAVRRSKPGVHGFYTSNSRYFAGPFFCCNPCQWIQAHFRQLGYQLYFTRKVHVLCGGGAAYLYLKLRSLSDTDLLDKQTMYSVSIVVMLLVVGIGALHGIYAYLRTTWHVFLLFMYKCCCCAAGSPGRALNDYCLSLLIGPKPQVEPTDPSQIDERFETEVGIAQNQNPFA